ncbi:MAG: nitronate monooxygenase [Actinobacteria bacterium]|nr:nitronate monooxygenase [Actinomycetota bacterium]
MITTWLTERFNLTLPLIAAPMGGTANGNFAAEVARTGALGMIAIGSKATAEWVEQEVASRPPGTERWGIGTLAWVVDQRPELLDAALAAQPPLLSISYGPYARHLEAIRAAGSVVTTQVGTLAEALDAEQAGFDFLVVRGSEGGGHGRDVMATLPLLQEVLEGVELPVVAGGGIANRRGLAAVLAAGAVGGWVGTAFLGCAETAWTDEARDRVISAADGDTIYTRSFDSGLQLAWPPEFGGRALQNTFSREWHEREPVSMEANEQMAAAVTDRNYEIAPLWAGQGVSLLESKGTVAEVVEEFARAEELLRRW